jgi:uncharacterized membrane protein YkoI
MFNSKHLFFSIVFLFSLTLAIGIFSGCGSQNPLGSADSALAPPTNVSGENTDKEPSYVSSIVVPDISNLAKITSGEATTKAQAEVAGTVVKTKLKNKGGNVVYDVEIDTGSGIKHVIVDAGNGTILNIEDAVEKGKDGDNEPSYVSSIRVPDLSTLPNLIPPEDATTAAIATSSGSAMINTELENEHGNVVYDVEIKAADGIIYEVTVDAGNAKILNTEIAGGGKGYGRNNNPGRGRWAVANPPIEDDLDDLDVE